jgi:hypothetical protein
MTKLPYVGKKVVKTHNYKNNSRIYNYLLIDSSQWILRGKAHQETIVRMNSQRSEVYFPHNCELWVGAAS